MHLSLYDSISARKIDAGRVDPLNIAKVEQQMIFCFSIGKDGSWELCEDAPSGDDLQESVLPAGDYLFSQERALLTRDTILRMGRAIENDGAYQRNAMADKIYLRYCYEDGSDVTQLFRPLKPDGAQNTETQ
jgi:hypothetical protein